MKKNFICCLFFAFFMLVMTLTTSGSEKSPESPTLVAQGKSIDSFVPKGWKLIKEASGDLNKDGLEDIVGVIEFIKTYEINMEGAPPRILFIAFKEKDAYSLSIQTDKAILRSDMGGVWGDPFESISVNRGSILITFYGGSNYRWGEVYRFRYQNNGWYLIGATIHSSYTGTGEETNEDYNLLTGKMIKTTIDKSGKKQEETINRGKKKLVNLIDFDVINKEPTKQF